MVYKLHTNGMIPLKDPVYSSQLYSINLKCLQNHSPSARVLKAKETLQKKLTTQERRYEGFIGRRRPRSAKGN